MSLSMTLLSLLSSRTFCCFPSDDLSLCPSVHLSSSQSVSQYNRPRLSHRTLRTLTSEWLFLRVLWQADLFNSSSVRPSLLLSVSPSCSPTCLTPCLSQDRSGLMGHFTDLQPSAETRAARLNRCTPRVRGHVITFDTHTHTHSSGLPKQQHTDKLHECMQMNTQHCTQAYISKHTGPWNFYQHH